MVYTQSIVVKVPLDEFIAKFDNIENLKHWQKGLVSVEHVSGNPGHLGAKMKFNFKFGNKKMELIETITYRDFPHELHLAYYSKGIHNKQENYFEETPEGHTKWTSKSEFLPLNFKMRAMMWSMPSAFKRQSLRYMSDFKAFVEKNTSVNHA